MCTCSFAASITTIDVRCDDGSTVSDGIDAEGCADPVLLN